MKHEAEVQEYPKAMHGPKDGYQVVNSKEEEDALGKGWLSGHEYWHAKAHEKYGVIVLDATDESGEIADGEPTDKPKRGRKPKQVE